MTNLTLKVKVTSFKLFGNLKIINEQFECKGKSLKLIFCKFEGQLDLQGQGQGHKCR